MGQIFLYVNFVDHERFVKMIMQSTFFLTMLRNLWSCTRNRHMSQQMSVKLVLLTNKQEHKHDLLGRGKEKCYGKELNLILIQHEQSSTVVSAKHELYPLLNKLGRS